MTASLTAALSRHYLEVLGGFPCAGDTNLPPDTKTLVLIGPKEPGFWAHLKTQPEWGGANPVDDWSTRVICQVAEDLGGTALFPFGGPPYQPFYQWALRSGQAWESPVRLLVHARQGLMVSFRGAIALRAEVDLPPTADRPCDTCPQPCLTACPAAALGATGYDVPACHAFLNQSEGANCLTQGCKVRRACPVSSTYARLPEQSAYHMGRFHQGQ